MLLMLISIYRGAGLNSTSSDKSAQTDTSNTGQHLFFQISQLNIDQLHIGL